VKPIEHTTPTARFLVYDHYVVAEPALHHNVTKTDIDALLEVAQAHISGPFGLIECRPDGSTIRPTVYRYAKRLMPQLNHFAVVTNNTTTAACFEIEVGFMEAVEGAIFSTLEAAQAWMAETFAGQPSSVV